MNGYFQLLGKADGTYLRLFPPNEGGEAISINDINDIFKLSKTF